MNRGYPTIGEMLEKVAQEERVELDETLRGEVRQELQARLDEKKGMKSLFGDSTLRQSLEKEKYWKSSDVLDAWAASGQTTGAIQSWLRERVREKRILD